MSFARSKKIPCEFWKEIYWTTVRILERDMLNQNCVYEGVLVAV